ncbi:Protein bli-3 [Homalodisca vitripennis]|nr:Protein bli-3 [Homalodisca vitripennis]
MYDKECEGGKSIPFHRAGYDRKTGQSPNSPREQVRKCEGGKSIPFHRAGYDRKTGQAPTVQENR